MERAEARKLQPHFIAAFFLEAFQQLGGTIRQREPKRYEITHVPAVIRQGDRGEPILRRYERICFEKSLITVPGKPPAEFICPGHPLLDAVLDLTLDRHRDLLRQGAILVDEDDPSEEVRALVYLEHSIQDGSIGRDGRRVVSRRMQYVELREERNENGEERRESSSLTPHSSLLTPHSSFLTPHCSRLADHPNPDPHPRYPRRNRRRRTPRYTGRQRRHCPRPGLSAL